MITQSHKENTCQAQNPPQALVPRLVSICIKTDNSFADVNTPKLCKILRKAWTNYLANPISCKSGLLLLLFFFPNYVSKTRQTIYSFVGYSDWSCSFGTVSSDNNLWEVFSQQIFWSLHFTYVGFCFLMTVILHLETNEAYS